MKSYLNHLQVNINPVNLNFYKSLMSFLRWNIIVEGTEFAGFKSYAKGDLWFVKSLKKQNTDYDNFGVNHVAIGVEKKEDVDKVAIFLKKQKIRLLFDTPRHRPEFCIQVSDYYQIMFKSPDNILFEIVYVGPKK